MKILAITDFSGDISDELVSKLKKEEFNFGVCSGDIADIKQLKEYFFKYGSKWEEKFSPKEIEEIRIQGMKKAEKVLDKLEELEKPIFIVGGNNELIKYKLFKKILPKYENCKLLDNEWITRNNINIFGYFNNETTAETHQAGRIDKELEEKLKKHQETVLLLSHYPPFGCRLDKLSKDNPVNPSKQVGSTKLTHALKNSKVDMVICGHLEEHRKEDQVETVRIINPGTAKRNEYAIIKVENNNLKNAKINYK